MTQRLLLAALYLAFASGCTDEGIVGTRAAASCEPGCEGDELCHPQLSRCVQCVSNADCRDASEGSLCDLASNACRACNADAGETCPMPECEPPDEPDDLFDDDCDLDEGDGSIDDDDDPTP